MRFLHTSDWHLGHVLYGKKRYEEFSSFFVWLLKTIDEQKIDTLIVAGDIFDTTAPSNKATELYYDFLAKLKNTICQNVIIVAGNHDSPTFLDAPKSILKALNVHVVGSVCSNLENEVITLYNQDKTPAAVIMAIPFLRERDIRSMHQGETISEGNKNLREAMLAHYNNVFEIAAKKQNEYQKENDNYVPIISTGHLLMTGTLGAKDKAEREIYIGSLVNIEANDFPTGIDYLALGHIHVAQKVGGSEKVRYSGTPYPMSFGEAGQDKTVVILDSKDTPLKIEPLSVPEFQKIVSIKGDVESLKEQLQKLIDQNISVYVEAHYTGSENVPSLNDTLRSFVDKTFVSILKVDNPQAMRKYSARQASKVETLEELTPEDVFKKVLDVNNIEENTPRRQALTTLFNKLVNDMHDEDKRAE